MVSARGVLAIELRLMALSMSIIGLLATVKWQSLFSQPPGLPGAGLSTGETQTDIPGQIEGARLDRGRRDSGHQCDSQRAVPHRVEEPLADQFLSASSHRGAQSFLHPGLVFLLLCPDGVPGTVVEPRTPALACANHQLCSGSADHVHAGTDHPELLHRTPGREGSPPARVGALAAAGLVSGALSKDPGGSRSAVWAARSPGSGRFGGGHRDGAPRLPVELFSPSPVAQRRRGPAKRRGEVGWHDPRPSGTGSPPAGRAGVHAEDTGKAAVSIAC